MQNTAVLAFAAVIVPLAWEASYGLIKGGGDYCDPVYYWPGGGIDPVRTVEFANVHTAHMILTGLTGTGCLYLPSDSLRATDANSYP